MKKNYLDKLFKLSILSLIVYKSVQLIIRIYNIIILNLVLGGNNSYRSKLTFTIKELKLENYFNYSLMISFFILLSVWFFQKYKHAHKITHLELSYKPIWALFSFAIPVFNVFAPYRIMNDLWTVYNKDMTLENNGKNLIKIWWFLSILLFIISRYIGIKFDPVSTLPDFLTLEYYSLVYFAISIHYYLLLRRLVKLIED